MRKFVLFVGLLAGLSALSIGQALKTPEQATIYLHDGSVYNGFILEKEPYLVTMLLSTRDTIEINQALIKRLQSTRDLLMHQKGRYHSTTGFFGYINALTGITGSEEIANELSLTIGFRPTKRTAVGLGGGIMIADTQLGSDWGNWLTHEFTTIHAYGRYYLNDRGWRLYADAKVGYGFEREGLWALEHTGGMQFQPGLGIHLSSKNRFKWHIGLSQVIQNTSGEQFNTGPFGQPINTQYQLWYNRTVLRIGLEFN